MVLRIQQIEYNHSKEVRTYESGVLSIDTETRQIHIHNGIVPNGIPVPMQEDLEKCANVDLTNVSQENITNMLVRYGALSTNDTVSLQPKQLDNVYEKLKLDGLQSDNAFDEFNVVAMNSKTRRAKVIPLSELRIYHGIDIKGGGIARASGVTYTADRDCYVCVHALEGFSFTIDGFKVGYIWPSIIFTSFENATMFPICKGQTYSCVSKSGFRVYQEFGALNPYKK